MGMQATNPVMGNKPWRDRIVAPVASTDGRQSTSTGSSFLALQLVTCPFLQGQNSSSRPNFQDSSLGKK